MGWATPHHHSWARCWGLGGRAETKGGARVIRASSLSPSNCSPLVFFLQPDVEDWCSYVSLFPRKTWAQFFRSSKHVFMFIRQRRISFPLHWKQVGGVVALTALGSVGLGCEVASSGCPKQGHHMFPSTPSSVRQATLSHKFLFFKKFANEYVKYSTAKGQDGWKKHSCIFQLCKLFFSGALLPESVLSNSVRRGVIQGHSAQLGATQDDLALFRVTLRNLAQLRTTWRFSGPLCATWSPLDTLVSLMSFL